MYKILKWKIYQTRFALLLVLIISLGNWFVQPVLAQDGWLEYGDSVTGYIDNENFEFNWEFSGNAGDIVDISMEGISGDLDTHLRLFNEDFRLLEMDDDSGLNAVSDALISNFELPYTGTYFIIASRYDQGSGTSSGDYRLTLTLLSSGETNNTGTGSNNDFVYSSQTITCNHILISWNGYSYRSNDGEVQFFDVYARSENGTHNIRLSSLPQHEVGLSTYHQNVGNPYVAQIQLEASIVNRYSKDYIGRELIRSHRHSTESEFPCKNPVSLIRFKLDEDEDCKDKLCFQNIVTKANFTSGFAIYDSNNDDCLWVGTHCATSANGQPPSIMLFFNDGSHGLNHFVLLASISNNKLVPLEIRTSQGGGLFSSSISFRTGRDLGTEISGEIIGYPNPDNEYIGMVAGKFDGIVETSYPPEDYYNSTKLPTGYFNVNLYPEVSR